MFSALVRVALVLIGMVATATGSRAAPKDWAKFAAELDRVGYFHGMSQSEAQELRHSILTNGWTQRHSFDRTKMVPADAEAISEGGFFDLADELRPLLSKHGVAPLTGEQGVDASGYWIELDGRRHFLYTAEEFRAERAGKPGLVWGLSTVRALMLTNERMAAAKAAHRAYAMSGGEELTIVLLTGEQASLIASTVEPMARPYRMTESYPLFGMPK